MNRPNRSSVGPPSGTGSPHVDGMVGGVQVDCLLDTGCTHSMISTFIFQDLPFMETRSPDRVPSMVSVTGGNITTRGSIVATVEFQDGIKLEGEFIVADVTDQCILGMDILAQQNCQLDLKSGVLQVGGQGEIPYRRGRNPFLPRCAKVTVSETVTLPPRHEVLVQGKVAGYDPNDPWRLSAAIEPHTNGTIYANGVVVGRTCSNVKAGEIPVRMLNPSSEPVTIYKGSKVGTLETVTLEDLGEMETGVCSKSKAKSGGVRGQTVPLVPEHLEQMYKQGCEHLGPVEQTQFADLCKKYEDVWSKGSHDIGRTNLIEHEIITDPAVRPIKQPARRAPFWKQQEAKTIVDSLLENKLIGPSTSPWASPVLLVRKKDGTSRMCVDYRRLNAVSVPDAFPLPRIDDSLDALGDAKLFSTLDLASGYWQVGLTPEASKKAAFTAAGGLWEWKVMPFGLCSAPGTFERLMELVLAGLQWEICLIYLDDIIVYGNSVGQMLTRLETVLTRIRNARLKLKPDKCVLFQKQVKFLGHVVSSEGVSTDPEKVSAVSQWPVPLDVHQVRSFLGTASYYRRFVRSFATIAKPLHRLTEKGQDFIWTTECQTAFDTLKTKLVEAPVLAYPLREGMFILDTDASGLGIGGVLSQVQDGVERPLAYASRTMTKPERNYSVTRRELLAVVEFCKHFRHYLIGRKFRLRTDHAALTWLKNLKDPSGQYARWQGTLGQFTYETVYRAGKQHCNADGLSRRPASESESDFESVNPSQSESEGDLDPLKDFGPDNDPYPPRRPLFGACKSVEIQPLWSDLELAARQKDDPDMSPIIVPLLAGENKPKWEEIAHCGVATKAYWAEWKRLRVRNGVIGREWENKNGTKVLHQVILPRSLVKEILRQAHSEPWSGHMGVRKTLERLRQRYFWYEMKVDVRTWIDRCDTCVRTKGMATARRRRAHMKTVRSGIPFERIAIDVCGPLPLTPRGNVKILVIGDYFTKWIEAYPIPNETSEVVAEKIVADFVSRFGVPQSMHSDQGRNFESQLFQQVCELLGIYKTRTTAYHPQSNGMVERFNRTMAQILRALVEEEQAEWDLQLPLALMAYRSSVHLTTGETPHMMLFGREMTVPLNLTVGEIPATSIDGKETEYVWALRSRLADAYRVAREFTGKQMRRQKRVHDRGVRMEKYQEGHRVWLMDTARRSGRCPKLQFKCKGPFLILKVLSDVTFRIMDETTKAKKVVHHDRLLPYVTPEGMGETESEPRATSDSPSSSDEEEEIQPVRTGRGRGRPRKQAAQRDPNPGVPMELQTKDPPPGDPKSPQNSGGTELDCAPVPLLEPVRIEEKSSVKTRTGRLTRPPERWGFGKSVGLRGYQSD